MGFFKKLFGIKDKQQTPPPMPKADEFKDSGLTIERKDGEVNVHVNLEQMVQHALNGDNLARLKEQEKPVYATEEQIEQLPLEDTKTGKVRRINCSFMPSSIIGVCDGTYVNMLYVKYEHYIDIPYIRKDGKKDSFGDLYAKDEKKFAKLVGLNLPFLAYKYVDWEYLQNTNAYYEEENRVTLIVYLGSKEDVRTAMKEDLALYNEKVRTDKHYFQ